MDGRGVEGRPIDGRSGEARSGNASAPAPAQRIAARSQQRLAGSVPTAAPFPSVAPPGGPPGRLPARERDQRLGHTGPRAARVADAARGRRLRIPAVGDGLLARGLPRAPGSYGAGFSSLSDAPTTVTGPGAATAGVGLGTGAGGPRRGGPQSSVLAPRAGRPPRPSKAARPARRARLLVRHIDPWSTLKFSFVLAVAMFFVWLVAVGVLYGVLDGMGVFDQINGLYDEVSGNGGDSLFSPGLVLGTAAVIGVVNIVLFTALATIGAFVYNICSDLVGGIEVTLAERD